jgi:phosphohistidine phosphatase
MTGPRTPGPGRLRGPGGKFLPAAAKAAISAGKAAIAAAPKPARKAGAKPVRAPAAPAERAPESLQLLFIRHADAGDSATWPGEDAVRPLSKKGRRQSRRLGDLLESLKVRPDVLLTSPKVRAVDTAKLVGRRVGAKARVDARLADGFDGAGLRLLVEGLPPGAGTVALVGHDPDFSTVVSWLTGAPIEMAKGALARVDLAGRAVGAGVGALRWLLPPDAVSG